MYIREIIPLYMIMSNKLVTLSFLMIYIHIIYHIRNLIFESKVNFVQSVQMSTNLNDYCFNFALLLHDDCADLF